MHYFIVFGKLLPQFSKNKEDPPCQCSSTVLGARGIVFWMRMVQSVLLQVVNETRDWYLKGKGHID